MRGNRPGVDAVRLTDRGFVLVSVLWLLGAADVGSVCADDHCSPRCPGRRAAYPSEAEALADGLTRLVALRLGDRDRRPLAEAGIATDGSPLHCSHEHASVEIAINDLGGLVDLNGASQPLLEWVPSRR
jgi:hypothetical protein